MGQHSSTENSMGITWTFCNPPVQQRPPQAPRKDIAHFPQMHGLYFYLTVVVTITHCLGLGKEENGHYHRVLQPKPFADPILTSPGGRAISAPHFCLLSSGMKLCFACSGLVDPDRNSWQKTPRLACPGILKFIFKSCYTESSWALRGLSRKGFSTRKQKKGLEILS